MDLRSSNLPRSEVHSTSAEGSEENVVSPFFPDMEVLAEALNTAEIGVWTWEISSDTITWSSNLEKIHRLPPGSFDGTFASFEKNIYPDDRATVLAAIKHAMATQGSYSVTYRLPIEADGEEHWVAARGAVVVENGTPQKLFGVCRDVTAQVRTEHELRMRAQRQEVVSQLGARALIEDDLEKLLDDLTGIVATMLDVDMVHVLELVPGDAELLFRSGHGWGPEIVRAKRVPLSAGSQATHALAARGPVVVADLQAETRFAPSPFLLEHDVVSGITTTIVGHDNRKYGLFSVQSKRRRTFNEYEVSLLTSVANIIAGAIQRRQLDRRQKTMIRELHHRSGNLFSQLLALFSQTAANSKSVGELVSKYEARVFALANAHRLMVEGGWQPASLLELLGIQLAPCLDRISLNGPNVYLEPDAAFALSTVTHELVSNAIKHGSLSALDGHVDVTWSVQSGEQGLSLVLNWREHKGHPPKRSFRPGFGSRLIETMIQRQMNGQVHREFLPDGMEFRMIVPLSHERWPEAKTPAELGPDLT